MTPESASLAPKVNQALPNCKRCGVVLPLCATVAESDKQTWSCAGCGAKYRAALVAGAPPAILANARLAILSPGESAAEVPDGTPTDGQRVPLPNRPTFDCTTTTDASRFLDQANQPGDLHLPPQGDPFAAGVEPHGAVPYDPEAEVQSIADLNASIEQVDSMIDAIEQGDPIAIEAHEAIAQETLVSATRDLDLFVRLGVNPSGDGYPGRHSLHVAMLASGIGAHLGWDHRTLVDLGVGCLIHDLGMTKVPEREYLREEVLDDIAFSRILAHPLHTFDLIEEHMDVVPLTTRMVAYQIHERCDGSGYPRKRQAPLVHQASKVAAVADVFVALVSPRPHRPALMPYHAVTHLLQGVRDGIFDGDSVRALLKTVSLFPIGSYLELADGRVARVIRSNPADYCRPVIEAWRPGELDAPAEVLDLLANADLTVRRPLPSLAA